MDHVHVDLFNCWEGKGIQGNAALLMLFLHSGQKAYSCSCYACSELEHFIMTQKLVRKQEIKLIYMVLCEDFIKFDVSTNQKCSIEHSVLTFLSESLLNPLSPKIQIQILQTDLHTFLLRTVERIWFKIKAFSLWSSI